MRIGLRSVIERLFADVRALHARRVRAHAEDHTPAGRRSSDERAACIGRGGLCLCDAPARVPVTVAGAVRRIRVDGRAIQVVISDGTGVLDVVLDGVERPTLLLGKVLEVEGCIDRSSRRAVMRHPSWRLLPGLHEGPCE